MLVPAVPGVIESIVPFPTTMIESEIINISDKTRLFKELHEPCDIQTRYYFKNGDHIPRVTKGARCFMSPEPQYRRCWPSFVRRITHRLSDMTVIQDATLVNDKEASQPEEAIDESDEE